MSNSNDFLQEYLDSLLNDVPLKDTSLSDINRAADESARIDESALKLAAGSNIAPLSNASRPARATTTTRPFAEPIRTLNLRMPLPPAIEAKQAVETKPLVEAKLVVETISVVEKVPVVETIPVVEQQSVEVQPVEAKLLVETKPLVETQSVEAQFVETPSVETLSVETKRIDVEQRVALPPTEQQPLSQPVQKQVVADLAAMAPPAAWLPNGRPQWAQQPFECLIFKAGGLQLAAPLVELGSIYPLAEDALTEIFGQTQWFMGLLPIKEYNIRTMDTGLVVMPERYNAAMREQYRYVVSLFGSDWGLAVDSVVGTTVLDPASVRWRGERNKRPWLAGMLIDQMCALFDISQLAWLFHNQDRKRTQR